MPKAIFKQIVYLSPLLKPIFLLTNFPGQTPILSINDLVCRVGEIDRLYCGVLRSLMSSEILRNACTVVCHRNQSFAVFFLLGYPTKAPSLNNRVTRIHSNNGWGVNEKSSKPGGKRVPMWLHRNVSGKMNTDCYSYQFYCPCRFSRSSNVVHCFHSRFRSSSWKKQ